jgi:hypothetical protein
MWASFVCLISGLAFKCIDKLTFLGRELVFFNFKLEEESAAMLLHLLQVFAEKSF